MPKFYDTTNLITFTGGLTSDDCNCPIVAPLENHIALNEEVLKTLKTTQIKIKLELTCTSSPH